MKGATIEYGADEKQDISKCLNCTKDDCDNCLVNKKYKSKLKRYSWQGKEYTAKELAHIKGYEHKSMCNRIRKYGLEFAMSDYRTYKVWLRDKEKGVIK